MRTTVIKRHANHRFVTMSEDYLSICTYEVETKVKGVSVKTNDCAAALLSLYEHRHNAFLANNEDYKGPVKQESGLGYLEKCLLFHYSQKSIKEANALLEAKGFISIERKKISDKQNGSNLISINVETINQALSLSEQQNYPTVKLPHPSTKITPPPTVKLPHPSTKITESNINSNINLKDNTKWGGDTSDDTKPSIVDPPTIEPYSKVENPVTPVNVEEEILLENELKQTALSLILASQIQNESYLMQYKMRVPDANMDDVKQLAEKAASDTILNLMKAEYLDSPKKVIEHIKKNERRVGMAARARMIGYCQTQNKRISVINQQVPVTTYPNSGVHNVLDERANPQSEKYCPYFDPESEFYISSSEIREKHYKEYINQNKQMFL